MLNVTQVQKNRRKVMFISQKALIPGLFAAASLTAGTLAAISQPSALATAPSPAPRFSDTQGHWAQPFIQSLADQSIVAGYPDSTFRPDAQMGRDEFSAIVRSAFKNQPVEREISSGGVYKDVPADYWAVPAIAEAYETGFVQGYPDGTFRPQQPVTKASAIASLAQNLNLEGAAVAAIPAPQTSPAASPAPQANSAPQQAAATRRRATLFPMAITSLMQPLVNKTAPVAAAVQAPQANASPAPSPAASPAAPSVSPSVSQYYEDADQIPPEAIAGVAAATRAGFVVNYPDARQLKPNQPASRAEIAAMIHQALVTQGRTAPIASNPAANYIVKP
jgi:hypothetical protein